MHGTTKDTKVHKGLASSVGNLAMPKRNLRIVKRVRSVPVIGICENCKAQFSGDPNRGNAQSAIQAQFNAHKCEKKAAETPARALS
jgi:hypothetical protein